jgi:hypothetical protein
MFTGFVGGVVFSAVLGVAAHSRRFDESPLSMVVSCGGAVGLLLGLLPLAINRLPSESQVGLVAGVVIGSMILVSVVSAAASLVLARAARAKGLPL